MAKNTSETMGHFDLYKTFDVDKKGGGKIRTKISENTRSSSQKVEDVPTTPAFIASFNAPSLPLKSLPVISYESKTTGTTSSNSIGNVQLFVSLIFILYARWRIKIVCLPTKLASLAFRKKI